MYMIQEMGGLVSSWILGYSEDWEKAPLGFDWTNADEWIKVDGKWIRDKERAQILKDEQEGLNETN